MRILTCPPGAETIGVNLKAFADNLMGSATRPVMEKHGVVNLEPFKWYPAQMLIDALNELSALSGSLFNLTAIGMKIGEITPMPPEIEPATLEKVVMIWDRLYQDLHRNADVGGILCEKISDKHFKTIHTVIYPDDLSYGVLYGFGRRFLPQGTRFSVFYDPDHPARDYGGQEDATIIHIKWD